MTNTRIETSSGYGDAAVGTFPSAFTGFVHIYLNGGEYGSCDMTPNEARQLAAGLMTSADETEGKS